MVERSGYEPGTPCWVDLFTSDVTAAEAFYAAVFGWKVEPTLDPDGNRVYGIFHRDGKPLAGLAGPMPGAEQPPPCWNSYLAVADADAALAAAKKAGGTVHMPAMDVFTAGRMGMFADPTGAMMLVWQAGDHPGSAVVNEPDSYSWNELLSGDVEASKRFYAEVFGWTYSGMDMGPVGTYWVIEGGDSGGLGGLMQRPPTLPAQVPDHWVVYFLVADLEAKLAAISAAGGTAVTEIMAVPGVGRFAMAHDPQHASFAMLQPEQG